MLRFLPAAFLLTTVAPLVAHADQIDDFVLTSTHHTLAWSLPAVIPNYNPDPGHYPAIDFWVATPTGSVDGVGGYSFYLTFLKQGLLNDTGFTIHFGPSLESGSTNLLYDLHGSDLDSFLLDDPVYKTGTFDYTDANYGFDNATDDGPYTLTITPEATSPTPEPATLALLATGTLGLLTRTKFRRPT